MGDGGEVDWGHIRHARGRRPSLLGYRDHCDGKSIKYTPACQPSKGSLSPHELAMRTTDVELEIAPPCADVVAARVGAVESEEDHGFFHHLLSLKEDGETRVFERDSLRGV